MNRFLHRIYPFLIAIYPVLALRNFNSAYVDLPSIVRTLLLVLGFTLTLWLVMRMVLRDWTASGVLTSLSVIVALAYGHVYNQIEKSFGEPIRHSLLSALSGGLLIAIGWFLLRRPAAMRSAGRFLANTAAILFLMSAGQAVLIEVRAARAADKVTESGQVEFSEGASTRLPDIYLILLDGHGRADVLQEEFGYDASPFINGLTEMGFYVAECSQSNYASTRYSVTSLFQMDYIQIVNGKERVPALKNTLLLQTLRKHGYSIITFENYASGHFDAGEDLRLSRHQLRFGGLDLSGGLNEFEKTMLNTSITRLLLDTRIIPGFNADALVRLEDYEHYLQTNYILEQLPELTRLNSPKFVFVHILVPHIPYVFTPDGDFRFPEDASRNGYRDNAEFIDGAILPVLQEIIAGSEQPPVILLMGDHGPPATRFTSPETRMKILNAYFVNLNAKSELYKEITPVNSFRVILSEYFDVDSPLLEDVSYYAYQFRQLRDSPAIMENTCSADR